MVDSKPIFPSKDSSEKQRSRPLFKELGSAWALRCGYRGRAKELRGGSRLRPAFVPSLSGLVCASRAHTHEQTHTLAIFSEVKLASLPAGPLDTQTTDEAGLARQVEKDACRSLLGLQIPAPAHTRALSRAGPSSIRESTASRAHSHTHTTHTHTEPRMSLVQTALSEKDASRVLLHISACSAYRGGTGKPRKAQTTWRVVPCVPAGRERLPCGTSPLRRRFQQRRCGRGPPAGRLPLLGVP